MSFHDEDLHVATARCPVLVTEAVYSALSHKSRSITLVGHWPENPLGDYTRKFRESTSITRETDRRRRRFSATRRCPCRTRNSTWSPPDCRGCLRRVNRGDRQPQVGSTVAGAATKASDRRRERDQRCRPPWDLRAATCSDSSPRHPLPDPVSTAEKYPKSCKMSRPGTLECLTVKHGHGWDTKHRRRRRISGTVRCKIFHESRIMLVKSFVKV